MLPRRKAEFTFDVAADHENYSRNRYKDVLPYDQTRVILATELENDYINASYINVRTNVVSVLRSIFVRLSDTDQQHGDGQPLHCHAGAVANDVRCILEDDLGAGMHVDSHANAPVREVRERGDDDDRKRRCAFVVAEPSAISIGRTCSTVSTTAGSTCDAVASAKTTI